MTPQLQQAIKLLALSNLEIEAFIGEALEANPLLDMGEAATPAVEAIEVPEEQRRTRLESSPVDQLIGEGRADDDRPLDIDPGALDRDRHTGDGGDWGGDLRFAPAEQGPSIEERGSGDLTLAEHLEAQIGTVTSDPRLAAIARYLVGQLDDAGYLPVSLRDVAEDLGLPQGEAEAGLALIHTLDPTGVGARSLGECIALQARDADRYDPAMARLIENSIWWRAESVPSPQAHLRCR
jgi:RNA polymerase sigma-54 factor